MPKTYFAQSQNHELVIDIPADDIRKDFRNRELGGADLAIAIDVPKKAAWYKFWSSPATTTIRFNTVIRLLPIFPLEYRIEQYSSAPVVDKSTTIWQPSRATVIGGCGDSGCYSNNNVFADLPPGTESTGKVRNCMDSYAGYGDFVREGPTINMGFVRNIQTYAVACRADATEVDAISAIGTNVRMVYRQHSHNVTRTVQFEAGYHPLIKRSVITQLTLKPLSIEEDDSSSSDDSAGKITEMKDLMALVSSIANTGSIFGAIGAVAQVSDQLDRKATKMPVENTQPKIGFLKYGQTYEARLSPDVDGWTIRVRNFIGDDLVASEQKTDPQLDVKVTDRANFKRLIVTPKPPY